MAVMNVNGGGSFPTTIGQPHGDLGYIQLDIGRPGQDQLADLGPNKVDHNRPGSSGRLAWLEHGSDLGRAWDGHLRQPRLDGVLSAERSRNAESTGRAERTDHGMGPTPVPGISPIGRLNARQKPGQVEDEAVGRRLTAGVLVEAACLLLSDGYRRDFCEE
jgi:hypothetical protein